MCDQICDTAYWNGNRFDIEEEPLAGRQLPKFLPPHTANHRGYVAVWSIVGGGLFLTALAGITEDESASGMDAVFPDATAPILADWYSGTISLKTETVCDRETRTPIFDDFLVLHIGKGRVLAQCSKRRGIYAPVLFRPIMELCEDNPALASKLERSGLTKIGDVAQQDMRALMSLPGFETEEISTLKDLLESRGLAPGTRIYNWSEARGK